LFIFSYYEDIWLDLDLLPVKRADIMTIVTPQLTRPVDLSHSRVWTTFGNVKRTNVWHKIAHSLKFYLLLPVLLFRYPFFLFIAPPYFHFLAMPVLWAFRKEVYTIAGDPYSEISKEQLWQASPGRKLLRKILYPAYLSTEYIGIKFNRKVFAVTKYVYNKYLPWTRVELARNGGPLEKIDKLPVTRATKEPYLFYVGGLVKWRGIDLLLKAFSIVKERYAKPLKLVIVGGTKEEFDNYPELKKMDNKDIVITGWLPPEKAWSYLKGAKIAVMPNRDTILSRAISSAKVFEYISAEIPQVCTDSGDHAELVRMLDVGMVTGEQPRQIAEAILSLLNNPKQYAAFRKNCRERKHKIDRKVLREPIRRTMHAVVRKHD